LEILPDVPIQNQLAGMGQLRDLRTNPNLKGADINFLLEQTPRSLDALRDNGDIDSKTYRQIMKAFEGRDLEKRGRNK
jgi:hypothetical protein